MLEQCDKCLLKWFANIDLEVLKYQHHVIQMLLQVTRHQKAQNHVPQPLQDFFPETY